MDEKTRALVAVGAAITANCQACLQTHAENAVRCGASAEEVAAAIEVGKRVRQGSSAKMDVFSASLSRETQAPGNP